MPTKHPWRLSEVTLKEVRENNYSVAVLPFGATEPHNLHMPYATDTIQVDAICDGAAAWAWKKGAKVAVLPTIPFGEDRNMASFPMTINLDQSVLNTIVKQVAESLERHGCKKLVLVNGHGGNDFKGGIRDLVDSTKVFICLVNWYQMMGDVMKQTFEHPGEHADEMETSLTWALAPDLITMEWADDGATRPSRFEAGRKGWVWYPRPMDRLTTNSGNGYPKKAAPEKGKKLLLAAQERLGQFLQELHDAPMDKTFPLQG